MNLRTPFVSLSLIALQPFQSFTVVSFQSSTFSRRISTTRRNMITMSSATPKSILYDMPVSNNGARCRLILYKKNIPRTEVDIVSPMDLNGLKSPEYLKRNPQGKMPLLSIVNNDSLDNNNKDIMHIPESDTICRYLLSTYEKESPSFLPNNTKSNLIARLHDMYLTTIQGCMYKATPPFGIYQTRSDALKEYINQLNIIDDLLDFKTDDDKVQYLCGDEVSLADVTLFPSIIFAERMLPKFGFDNALPNNILKWYNDVKSKDEDFAKVYDEIIGGLDSWEGKHRWDPIFLAGVRDNEPPTIFDKIINGEIPSSKVYEDDKVLGFKDINPVAPAHVLVIPKDRMNLSGLRKSSPDHVEILGRLLVAAGDIAKDKSLGFDEGARIVINDGKVS